MSYAVAKTTIIICNKCFNEILPFKLKNISFLLRIKGKQGCFQIQRAVINWIALKLYNNLLLSILFIIAQAMDTKQVCSSLRNSYVTGTRHVTWCPSSEKSSTVCSSNHTKWYDHSKQPNFTLSNIIFIYSFFWHWPLTYSYYITQILLISFFSVI